ncbi:MAG: phage tail assembly chaperone [Hyphomonas sp.]
MLPWGEMLRAAMAAGIGAKAFWQLSLREWRWIASAGAGPGRRALDEMMARFPDEKETGI